MLRSYNGEKPNITGFEMRKFLAATGSPRYDPWERKYVNLLPASMLSPTQTISV